MARVNSHKKIYIQFMQSKVLIIILVLILVGIGLKSPFVRRVMFPTNGLVGIPGNLLK